VAQRLVMALEWRTAPAGGRGLRVRAKAGHMGWILLEAAVALAIGLFIVWWTWPRDKRPPPREDEDRQ